MDDEGKVVTEPGVSGEICCAGESLAIGYYTNPEQTAKQFIMYDLNGNTERVYKTGDLAAYGTDGELYFAGRGDFQIKHMGHRIELGELEAAARTVDGVTAACAVFDRAHSVLGLVYAGTADRAGLLNGLRAKVPEYLLPKRTLCVDALPLTENGKTDRKAATTLLFR
jgi:acyl-coenzyme A synthetase/AMP-(fatty) acid ligase